MAVRRRLVEFLVFNSVHWKKSVPSNGENRVSPPPLYHVHSWLKKNLLAISCIGFFFMPPFLCHPKKFLKFLCHPILCHPQKFYATLYYATP